MKKNGKILYFQSPNRAYLRSLKNNFNPYPSLFFVSFSVNILLLALLLVK